MRALIVASLLGSAMSVETLIDGYNYNYYYGSCDVHCPEYPCGLITEDPGNIDTYFVEHPIILKGG